MKKGCLFFPRQSFLQTQMVRKEAGVRIVWSFFEGLCLN